MTVDTLHLPVATAPDHRVADAFPLPLVPFEQYMLEDDRPDYPTHFFLRLGFSGTFDRPAFLIALKASIERHPMLRAHIHETEQNRYEWRLAENPEPLVTWRTGSRPSMSAACPHIDLRHETGLRIFCGEQSDQTNMLLQFHHSCCDGMGAVRFAEDLLGLYHNALADESQQMVLPRLDPCRLRGRNLFGMSLLRYLLRLPKELAGALGSIQYFTVKPVALVPRPANQSGEPESDRPATAMHALTDEETAKYCLAAKLAGCTVNDLLLRDLFLAMHEWAAKHAPESKADWFRIMIPTNLRTPADAATPAANMVALVFNDRRPERAATAKDLLNIIRVQVGWCKRWRLGLSTLHLLGLVRRFRGGLQRLLRTDRSLATAVLSNLGDLTRVMVLPRQNGRLVAANVTLEQMELLPPIRPLTHASFGVLTYAGRLTVSLMYDACHFTKQGGHELLDGFVRRIKTTLNDDSAE